MCVYVTSLAVKFSFSFHSYSMCGREIRMLCTFCFASCYPSGLWSLCHWSHWIDYLSCDQHFVAMGFGVLSDLVDQGECSHCLPDPGYFGNLRCS